MTSAAKEKAAARAAAGKTQREGDPSESPTERFRVAKTAQKAQLAAIAQAGPGAEARLAAQAIAIASERETREGAQSVPVTRREFLMYAWAASVALLLAGSGASTFFFVLPRFKAGEFGGTFTIPVGDFPSKGGAPISDHKGKFWLVHTKEGLNVLYNVCTHLGCLYKWSGVNHRFECPCHGSKFELDGAYIEGPAPRSLDRFDLAIRDSFGGVVAQSDAEGEAIQAQDAGGTVVIDTSNRILGQHHHLEIALARDSD